MKILVTGGTGSLGTALVPRLIENGNNVTVLSRDPHKQHALRLIAPRANFILGDVADMRTAMKATKGIEVVVHAAALKHVDIGELSPEEYTRVNVLGSINIAEACRENGVRQAILISSDKAVEPINLYGKTKAIAEDVFTNSGFNALRYGNVVSSRGSFLNVSEKALEDKRKIVVRSPSPTRFLLNMNAAIDLIYAVQEGLTNHSISRGSVCIPSHMSAFSIMDVALMFFRDEEIELKPLLPGEKRHEILLANSESVDFVHGAVAQISKYGNEKDRDLYCSNTCHKLVRDELADALLGVLEGLPLLKERLSSW